MLLLDGMEVEGANAQDEGDATEPGLQKPHTNPRPLDVRGQAEAWDHCLFALLAGLLVPEA